MKTLALALVLVASTALAGDKDKADTLFKQGKKLMGEKKYAEACEAFEHSMKLDPGIGTELNIARCYQEWGKLGRALRSYQAAEKMAKDANDSRADKIDGLVTELDPQVPRLTIHLPAGASTAGITIDGTPVDSVAEPIILDPGPHTLVYPGAKGRKTKIVPVERGGSSEVTLDVPTTTTTVDTTQPPPPPTPRPRQTPSEPDPGRGYRLAAYGIGGAGVAAIAVSSYLTLSARSKYNDALEAHCGGTTSGCDDVGLDRTHDARHKANIATIVFSAGLAAVGGGVVLYLLAPKATHGEKPEAAALYVVPSISPDGAGLVVGGHL